MENSSRNEVNDLSLLMDDMRVQDQGNDNAQIMKIVDEVLLKQLDFTQNITGHRLFLKVNWSRMTLLEKKKYKKTPATKELSVNALMASIKYSARPSSGYFEQSSDWKNLPDFEQHCFKEAAIRLVSALADIDEDVDVEEAFIHVNVEKKYNLYATLEDPLLVQSTVLEIKRFQLILQRYFDLIFIF